MGKKTTKYEYTDSDGDVHTFKHVERWCRCGGDCEKDTVEYRDPCDGSKSPPYLLDLESSELKWFMNDLIAMAIESGRMTKIE